MSCYSDITVMPPSILKSLDLRKCADMILLRVSMASSLRFNGNNADTLSKLRLQI